jgi:histidyl-tRNA synthetase
MERLPGFRDFYPEPLPSKDAWSIDLRNHIFARWRETARRYAFREYDGPPLETLELYTAKSGAEIVRQLYNFDDKGGEAISLRPEMTPTLARMVAAAERNYKKPIKWFATPQLFRYERQQRGRLREHFQFNADIFGEKDPAADAELIALLIDTLRSFGLTDQHFAVRLSSREAWQRFFKERNGDPAREYEFFQIIDKLERDSPEAASEKLGALGLSLDVVQGFIAEGRPTEQLEAILTNLRMRHLQDYVRIDYGIIRGLAYYTGPVFEAFAKAGDLRAIAGGGRYDHLVKLISKGKVDLPALGFGMGDVVLKELLQETGLIPAGASRVDVFCLIEEEAQRPATLGLVQALREHGLVVEYSLTAAKPDKQFKRAQELGAVCTVRCLAEPPGGLAWKHLRTQEQGAGSVEDLRRALGQGALADR